MITASHNPCSDNGIKLVDPLGEMLDISLEDELTKLVNMSDEDFMKAIEKFEQDSPPPNENTFVHIGYDTRPSSPLLSLASATAVEQSGIRFIPNGNSANL